MTNADSFDILGTYLQIPINIYKPNKPFLVLWFGTKGWYQSKYACTKFDIRQVSGSK